MDKTFEQLTMTMPALIDTHVHINFPEYAADMGEVAARWRAAGVVQMVHSCVTPAEFERTQKLADQFPGEVYLSVGLHPLDCESYGVRAEQLTEQLYHYAQDPRVVAIGETGLDFFKAHNHEQQRILFQCQIKVAQALDLPLIIHCRDAAQMAREILQEAGAVRAVMHCWTGTPEETAWFLELGCYISFSGVVTFKKAEIIQQSLQVVPLDKLLIETDCPFLAPVPMRGKRNEPAFVAQVAHKVAELKQLNLTDLAALTTHNARQVFRLPDLCS